MKKLILIVVLAFLISGCVSAEYNPQTGKISYKRLGDQTVQGLEIILEDGSSIAFEKQEATAQLFTDMLSIISDAYKAGLTAGNP